MHRGRHVHSLSGPPTVPFVWLGSTLKRGATKRIRTEKIGLPYKEGCVLTRNSFFAYQFY